MILLIHIYLLLLFKKLLSHVWLFVTNGLQHTGLPLSFTISQSLLKFMSIESVMPSSHLMLCRPLLLLPPTFPSIRVFSNELALCTRWTKYWSFSFSISPSNDYRDWSPLGWTGWISWRCQVTSRPGAWAVGVLLDADAQQMELGGKSFPIVLTHFRPTSSLTRTDDREGLQSDPSATSSSSSNLPPAPLPELSSPDANITYNPSTSGPHLEDWAKLVGKPTKVHPTLMFWQSRRWWACHSRAVRTPSFHSAGA